MKTNTTKAKKSRAVDAATNQKLLSMVKLEPPTTREELILLCQSATRMTIERDTEQLKLERRMLDLQEAHAPKIEKLDAEIEQSVKLIELWALAHREEEFGDRQGITVAGSALEFQKGTGKIVADVDDKTALNQILSLPASYEEEQRALVRVSAALNKQAALAMAKTDEGAAFLDKMGLRVAVEETFKWTPAREDLTPLTIVGGKQPVLSVVAA
jgi:phage host-nuclease inhibitor protein Gam